MMRSKKGGHQAPDDLCNNTIPSANVPTTVTEDEPLKDVDEDVDDFDLFDLELEDEVFCDEAFGVILGQRIGDDEPDLVTYL